MRSPRPRPDWHREDIKAALRKRGHTLISLSRSLGLVDSNVTRILATGRSARVQALIANILDVPPQVIWPSRYNADGTPRRRGQPARGPATAQRQNDKAA